MHTASMTISAPDVAVSAADSSEGRCDRIVVEIRCDGQIRVLDEPMTSGQFEVFLALQRQEALPTLVSIRWHQQSDLHAFRSVTQACQRWKIPYLVVLPFPAPPAHSR
jgi:biopolymer transport protein ExbD